jgi:hypothetical protein
MALCLECKSGNLMSLKDDDEAIGENGEPFMCEDCGHEQTLVDWKYRNYKIG